jgi:hypothetical protein
LELGDVAAIADSDRNVVETYNRDDCQSTWRLRDWLETVRAAAIADGADIARPDLVDAEPSEALNEWQLKIAGLVDRLATGVPDEPSERTAEEHGRWILAHSLDWHRRENKASWWEYFRLGDLPAEDLEVQELALEGLLRQKFPRDLVEPVPKGEFGGDLVQRVVGPAGQICGSILWEAKRTKNWSDNWLGKVREDQRAAKADVALIVSHALPKGLQTFDQIDGVWVTEPRCAVAVAIALRESLIALTAARLAGEGQQTKMEVMYQYLTGPRFRHRIEAVVERFTDMQADLDRERKTMTRLWAKREEQIRGVVESTAGLYGDLQGIAGRSLLEIDGLVMPLLDGPPAHEAAE